MVKNEQEVVNQLKGTIENLVVKDRFSGAVLLANREKILYSGAFGLANKEKGIINSIGTKFNLASMNKMFTSVAIAILEEQGKLSVHDSVQRFIPEFPYNNITVHQLLSHTSGLGDFFNDKFLEKRDKLKNVSDYLQFFLEEKLQFEPGTRFEYSNGGYIILGLIIEQISNLNYYEFVKKYIFIPLGMKDTDSYDINLEDINWAVGYTNFKFDGSFQEEKTDNLSLCTKGSPAGGGYSTIKDLLKFSRGLLSNELISPEQTEQLTVEKEVVHTDENSSLGYGYGFFVERINGCKIIGHDGGFPGVSNRLDIYPNEEYIFIVLANDDGGGAAITREVRKLLVNLA